MKTIAIVGKFDENGGRSSVIGGAIARELNWSYYNGGHLECLASLNPELYDVMLWMPEIPNNQPKLVPRLKARNRKLLLISSKRCRNQYTDSDVVGRLLKSKSNLGIAIHGESPYLFNLLDPLGNIFCNTRDISELCRAIRERVDELSTMTRLASHRVQTGCDRDFSIDRIALRSEDFLEVVREYGHTFARYVNAINPNRYLGNAATRCAWGFPAERGGGTIFVSRRDVPKDTMASDDFVEVVKREDMIFYWGEHKPSVDAPVQVMLFEYFKHIRYMIHGHVYVKDAPITQHKYPCGAMQEFFAVTKLADSENEGFAVNLRGHGCLIACKDLAYFGTHELVARPFPES
jgi:hypothetical protein